MSLMHSNTILKSKYSSYITQTNFKSFLSTLKIPYTVTELKEFGKIYGKLSDQGDQRISIETLIKLLNHTSKKPTPASAERIVKKTIRKQRSIKSNKQSFVISRSFSTEESSKILDKTTEPDLLKDLLDVNQNSEKFMKKLFTIFQDEVCVVNYFFLSRSEEINYEDFEESCICLGIEKEFEELNVVFHEIKDGDSLSKIKFASYLTDILHLDEEDVFITQDCSDKLLKISPISFVSSLNQSGFKSASKDIESLKRNYSNQNSLKKSDLRGLKIIDASYCSIKTCDLFAKPNTNYCKKHHDKLLTRAKSFIKRVQLHMPSPRNQEMMDSWIYELKKNPNNIRNEIEAIAPGQLYTKHDVVALQELIKNPEIIRQKETNFKEFLMEIMKPSRKFSQGLSPLQTTNKGKERLRISPRQIPIDYSFSRSPARRIVRLR